MPQFDTDDRERVVRMPLPGGGYLTSGSLEAHLLLAILRVLLGSPSKK